MKDLKEFENILGYSFKNKKYLEIALTHKSVTSETGMNNQRLEFLGDSILGAVIASYLFDKFNYYTDGELTRLKSNLVKKETLAYLAEKLDLPKYLKRADLKSKPTVSMLEDALESLIGAIFKDSDFTTVYNFTVKLFENYLNKTINDKYFLEQKLSYTSALKELSEKLYKKPPKVTLIKKEGKDNSPVFLMEVRVADIFERARGKSKKEAVALASEKLFNKLTKTSKNN